MILNPIRLARRPNLAFMLYSYTVCENIQFIFTELIMMESVHCKVIAL